MVILEFACGTIQTKRSWLGLHQLLTESNWLSEFYPLSEEVSSLSEYKTLENAESVSSTLSTQPTCQMKILSLLALSASKPLSSQPLTLAQRDMLAEHAFVS
ncbi:hypothetical protein JHK82_035427 [Glycine max]|nr:hypothetical protein JHK85_036146 [Glycine max]KAG4976082.1 hypothetical protein JHK86_035556 [Glycine max]KAG5112158.1 hypothetical protein JHK82_035427 [Glycine max]KAG5129439.1 hypothetical protein JHK84_035836 [Glycine max]